MLYVFLREENVQEEHGKGYSINELMKHRQDAQLRVTDFRIYDPAVQPNVLVRPGALPAEVDPPLEIPQSLPTVTRPNQQERFSTTPIYDSLT